MSAGKRAAGRPASPIDAYIAAARPDVRQTLERIREVIRKAAPGAVETISYRMPAFVADGPLVYFAPFTAHIGLFPPVRGDAALLKALAPYSGPKGNLRFPLDRPMPYPLIRRVVKQRLAEQQARREARAAKSAARRASR